MPGGLSIACFYSNIDNFNIGISLKSGVITGKGYPILTADAGRYVFQQPANLRYPLWQCEVLSVLIIFLKTNVFFIFFVCVLQRTSEQNYRVAGVTWGYMCGDNLVTLWKWDPLLTLQGLLLPTILFASAYTDTDRYAELVESAMLCSKVVTDCEESTAVLSKFGGDLLEIWRWKFPPWEITTRPRLRRKLIII